jgi:hypothetical protein
VPDTPSGDDTGDHPVTPPLPLPPRIHRGRTRTTGFAPRSGPPRRPIRLPMVLGCLAAALLLIFGIFLVSKISAPTIVNNNNVTVIIPGGHGSPSITVKPSPPAPRPAPTATTHKITLQMVTKWCQRFYPGADTTGYWNDTVMTPAAGIQCWHITAWTSVPWYSAATPQPLDSYVLTDNINTGDMCRYNYGPSWKSYNPYYNDPEEPTHPQTQWECVKV